MAIELATNKDHLVIKRNGSIEPYSDEKMRRVLMWACEDNTILVDNILEAVEIRIYNRIHISLLFDEVMDTVNNLISRLTPVYAEVLKRLYIQKTYKELWGIKRNEYPTLKQYFDEFSGPTKELISVNLTSDELQQLDAAIVPERDLLSTYLGLTVFFEKYSVRRKELLQHGFMRMAIQPYINEPTATRVKKIINRYNNLSLGIYTEATPKFKNSLKHKFYGASCCVHKAADNTESINAVTSDIGQYSRADGGNACDVSDWRASNSPIGLVGKSNGPIPFIKNLEASVNAFNQNCYSEDTEILTENGWKLISNLQPNEKVAQFNQDESIEFVHYTDFFESSLVNEDMIKFSMASGRYIDLLVTPNHRMVKKIMPTGNIKIQFAKDIDYGSDNYMLVSGNTSTVSNNELSSFDRFNIAYQADGGKHNNVNGKQNNKLAYYFRLTKTKKVNRLQAILDELPEVEYTKNVDSSGVTVFYITIPQKNKQPSKDFNWMVIGEMSYRYAREVIEEVSNWDSNIKSQENGKPITFYSINKEVVDKLSAVATICGYRTNIHKNDNKNKESTQPLYSISFIDKNTVASSAKSKKPERGILKETVKYTGKIYCVTVPSSIIVVRRNGKTAISGNSTRPGVCAVYYQWWHADIMALLPLMDEGGKENQRARGLKFGIKLNRLFLRAITANEDVYLFDPAVVPHLNNLYGEAFDLAYEQAVLDKLYTSVIPARKIALAIAKERLETGNLYIFFIENVNENTPFKDTIHSSNLCVEIFLPTVATKFNKPTVSLNLTTNEVQTTAIHKTGLTALCNLSSINVDKWLELPKAAKRKVAEELLESSDNLIDVQTYPTPEGEAFNRNYRAIGIGMNNLAYTFAKRNVKFTDDKALTLMETISASMHEVFNEASYNLALKRGSFPWFHKTKLTEPRRFATLFALPPGATNSLIIGATEGIEPISKILSEKTGTYSTKQLAPGTLEYGSQYQLSMDIPTKRIYDLAAIRQRYLDQGQSVNTYAKDPSSAYEVVNDILYAESIGLKSLYYLQSNTAVENCDSCGA